MNGLYISRQIVEAHGGEIAVTSEPNEGSLFVVTLPRYLDRAIGSRRPPSQTHTEGAADGVTIRMKEKRRNRHVRRRVTC
jgi:hypothetical protein